MGSGGSAIAAITGRVSQTRMRGRNHRLEGRAGGAGIDRMRGTLDAFAHRRRFPADEERCTGIQQHDIALWTFPSDDHALENRRGFVIVTARP